VRAHAKRERGLQGQTPPDPPYFGCDIPHDRSGLFGVRLKKRRFHLRLRFFINSFSFDCPFKLGEKASSIIFRSKT
jgi:hypothetical protein